MHRKTESEQTRNRPDDKDVKYAAGRRREKEKMKRKEETRGERNVIAAGRGRKPRAYGAVSGNVSRPGPTRVHQSACRITPVPVG